MVRVRLCGALVLRVSVIWCLMLAGIVAQATGQQARRETPASFAGAPDWYISVAADSSSLIARGKGKSKDRQVAVDKAAASARSNLAGIVERRWTVLIRAIEHESGIRREGKSEPVVLSGSSIKKQSLTRRGRTWTAYVLVAVPEESVHEFLRYRLRRNGEWYEKVKESRAVLEFEASVP